MPAQPLFQPGELIRISTVHNDPALTSEVVECTEAWVRVRLTKPTDSHPTERLYSASQVVYIDTVSEEEGQRYRAELEQQGRLPPSV
jgi:hypothetical protein